ncbi:DUF202 domain-containing protein [Corynebacterium hylobatis]|uniref:DUF202 domain-containing protein n=1 Tax=Corynebacterium hylobatis TaxID=1859290 RepID=A0A3S0C1Q7_9CORY|nr:DUF202 domain-containing protein [Corynebacterium hylobatis]RSZ63919.1 DUF202 domain-containing protein [Corynebacterium hylobatis]
MTSPTAPQPREPEARRDWENRVLGGGEEPDPRFTLANERTFLAWTRTSLAFLAGGIALAAFPLEQISDEIRTLTAIFVVVIGLLISGGAAMRWLRVERAMRHGRPLPIPAIVPLLSFAAVCACVLTIVMLF